MTCAKTKRRAISVALTWDGARWPVVTLPRKAREFLGLPGTPAGTSARDAAALFADHCVNEIRICWVPRLRGGSDVLAKPFQTSTGLRVGFKVITAVRFGDILGVVYRRKKSVFIKTVAVRGDPDGRKEIAGGANHRSMR